MRGLRTQEDNNFIKFFEVVQKEAQKQHKVFFLDCEEGRDGNVNGIETCNLSGWLVPDSKANAFENIWTNHREGDEWSDFFCFAVWSDNDGIKIQFE